MTTGSGLIRSSHRPGARLRTSSPRTLRLAPDDEPARWLLRISPEPVVTYREVEATEPADCTVRGPAAALYLALWNQGGLGGLVIDGDASLLDLCREKVTIRWT